MKALLYREYGSADGLRLEEVPTPTPTDDEILIEVCAVSLNGSDREGLLGRPLYARIGGLRRPRPRHRILGSDIAGRVVAAGRNDTEFRPGDEVFGELPGYRGGLAEYVCTRGRTLARKPARMTFEEAAAIPQGGVIALQGIREQGRVRPGQRVLINGAGGSAGAFALQLAKLQGAEVTAVDHPAKVEFLRSLGADQVLDYTREDFTRTGERYDLILDLVAHRSVAAYRRALRPEGVCLLVGGSVATLVQALAFGSWRAGRAGGKVRVLVVPQSRTDLLAVTELWEAGEIVPAIDRRYSLAEAAEAVRSVAEGRAKGKVVITVGDRQAARHDRTGRTG